MNYYAILLNKMKAYIENDAFVMTFDVYNEQNDLVTDLSAFKIACRITNDADTTTKRDANYSTGSADEISASAGRITVNIDTEDTDNYYGDYILELQIENIVSGWRQTIYRDYIKFLEEELDI